MLHFCYCLTEVLFSYVLSTVKQLNSASNARNISVKLLCPYQSAYLHNNKDKTAQCSKCTNVNDDCHALSESKTSEPTRRSFKVNDFGTNRKRICDFLLVRDVRNTRKFFPKYAMSEITKYAEKNMRKYAEIRIFKAEIEYLMPPKRAKYTEKICDMRKVLKYAENAEKCQICGNRIFAYF